MRRSGVALVAVAVAVALTGCGGRDSRELPDLVMPALAGGDGLDAGSLTGPAVINLWATWCAPCTEELPDFQRASEDLTGVRFIGMDETGFGENAASVDFLADLGVTYEQFVDADGAFASEIDVTELPATLIVDEDGDIAWFRHGQVSYDELREGLQSV